MWARLEDVEWGVCDELGPSRRRRELAADAIHKLLSRMASISSVARVGCGFSAAVVPPGGLDSLALSKFARLRLMIIKLPMREPNIRVFRMAVVEEYTM